MYKCDSCKNCSQPKEVLKKIVANKRLMNYYNVTLKHKRNGNSITLYHKLNQTELDMYRRDNFEISSEKYTKGWEIASEFKLCQKCYDKVENESNNSGK